MAQGAVGLGLERIREFGVSLFVINKRPESTLDSIVKCDHERATRNRVSTVVEEELHQNCISGRSQVSNTSSNGTA
jgi:hypothetical protein